MFTYRGKWKFQHKSLFWHFPASQHFTSQCCFLFNSVLCVISCFFFKEKTEKMQEISWKFYDCIESHLFDSRAGCLSCRSLPAKLLPQLKSVVSYSLPPKMWAVFFTHFTEGTPWCPSMLPTSWCHFFLLHHFVPLALLNLLALISHFFFKNHSAVTIFLPGFLCFSHH